MVIGLASFAVSFWALIVFASDLTAAVVHTRSDKIVIAILAVIAVLISQGGRDLDRQSC